MDILKISLSTSQLFIASLIVSAVICYFSTPLVIKLAHKIGAIDVPKDNRRVHKVPIPRLGGLAISIAFFKCGFICYRNKRDNSFVYSFIHNNSNGYNR